MAPQRSDIPRRTILAPNAETIRWKVHLIDKEIQRIESTKTMTTTNRTKLTAYLLVAIGGWAQTLPHWADAVTPIGISGLFLVIGGGLGLAFGVDTNGVASGLVKRLTNSGTTPVPPKE